MLTVEFPSLAFPRSASSSAMVAAASRSPIARRTVTRFVRRPTGGAPVDASSSPPPSPEVEDAEDALA